jgi:hypothetical protein
MFAPFNLFCLTFYGFDTEIKNYINIMAFINKKKLMQFLNIVVTSKYVAPKSTCLHWS